MIDSSWWSCTHFFYKQHFCKQRQTEISKKKKANAKPHPPVELLLLENYSHSSSALSSKNNRIYSKKLAKEQVALYSWDYTINHNENEDDWQIDHIDRPRPRHGHKHSKYTKCLSMMMLMY